MEDGQAPRFVNQCFFTQEIYQEAIRHVDNRKWYLFVAGVAMVPAFLEPRDSWKAWLIGVLGYAAGLLILLGAFAAGSKKTVYNRYVEQSRELYNGRDPETRLAFYESGFVYENRLSGGVMTFAYPQVARCDERERTIQLKLMKGNTFLLDKNGFSDQSAEEFCQFIMEKCPQARWKQHRRS